MIRGWPATLWIAILMPVLFSTACSAASDSSEEDETAETSPSHAPPAPRKGAAPKSEPAVEIGTAKSPSTIDGTSLAKTPLHLRDNSPLPKASAPKSSFLVAIDIGHTKNHSGAISARGIAEYDFNRRMSRELFDSMQSAAQFRSLLINPGGTDIGLVKRAQVANDRLANLFLAIHHDSVKDQFLKDWQLNGKDLKYCDDFHGYSVFFSRKNAAATRSREFAMVLGEELLTAGFTPTLHHVAQEHRPIIDREKGVYAFDDLLVLKNARMPAVLLECGVIVNRNEEEQVNSQPYRAKMISAIEAAITDFAHNTPQN